MINIEILVIVIFCLFLVNNIPDSANKALRVAAPSSTVAGMLPPTKEWSPNVVNMVRFAEPFQYATVLFFPCSCYSIAVLEHANVCVCRVVIQLYDCPV